MSMTVAETCSKSIKDYNKLLRWKEVDNAGLKFMIKDGRDKFIDDASDFNKRQVTITDYRIRTMDCADKKTEATAVVDFDYYVLPSNRIKTVTYKQDWIYLEEGDNKLWKIKSSLPEFK